MEKSESLHAVKGKSEKIVFAIFFVIFFLYALSLLYPMVWMFFSSLKKSLEYEAGDPFALPKYWRFENYLTSFRTLKVGETGYFGMIWNSLWINVLSIAEGVFVSAAVCYVVAKISFPGRKVVYSVIILQMMLPIYGSMAPALLLSKNLNIYDTPLQVIISSLAVGGSKFLILQAFFKGIPWEYAEAAYMDGASHWQVFVKIMFPQALAPMMTFAITDFIGGWNDYMTSLIWLPSFPTLATGLYKYEAAMIRSINYPVYFCGVIISAIPVLTVFICFRDTFMSSLSMGGLKG